MDETVHPQGSVQSIGLFKTGVRRSAPRLTSTREEMDYASTPGGLAARAMQSPGMLMPQEIQTPEPQPPYMRQDRER